MVTRVTTRAVVTKATKVETITTLDKAYVYFSIIHSNSKILDSFLLKLVWPQNYPPILVVVHQCTIN